MTPEHEKHLARILAEAQKMTDAKYRRGQEHHGGALWELTSAQLIEEALGEAIDQTVYLLALRDKLRAEQLMVIR